MNPWIRLGSFRAACRKKSLFSIFWYDGKPPHFLTFVAFTNTDNPRLQVELWFFTAICKWAFGWLLFSVSWWRAWRTWRWRSTTCRWRGLSTPWWSWSPRRKSMIIATSTPSWSEPAITPPFPEAALHSKFVHSYQNWVRVSLFEKGVFRYALASL